MRDDRLYALWILVATTGMRRAELAGLRWSDIDFTRARLTPRLPRVAVNYQGDATCNRARILAWWTRHRQARIGLATGHTFDVLDIDGPKGERAIRTLAATHGLESSGPLVHTGGGGWYYYLAPTGLGNVRPAGLAHVDWRGRAAMWSPHPAAMPPATPTGGPPAGISTPQPARPQQCC